MISHGFKEFLNRSIKEAKNDQQSSQQHAKANKKSPNKSCSHWARRAFKLPKNKPKDSELTTVKEILK